MESQNPELPKVTIDAKYLKRFEACGIQRSAIQSAVADLMESAVQAQSHQIAQVIGVEQEIWKDIAKDYGLPLDRQWRIEPAEDGKATLIDLGPMPEPSPEVLG